ncbi:MAG TPA: thioredoxin, partial [Methylomirabilota bacterium]|nr:thioredoxin [Methylomirabilota bacterium]
MSEIDEATDPAALIEAYYEAGWTDGLPVVPPSDASIAAMLAAAGLEGHEELGAIPGRNAIVIADKAATNAVMAGCRPEYMPVVVAAVKSLCAPAFAYHGPASSTGGSAMALVVNGPIAPRLGINSGNNAFGQGHRPNATIGRAVRLIMMNAMNTRPGFLDRATLGNPGKYTFCFAEHEAGHPWEPLHVSRGLSSGDSAVTLIASNSLYQVYNQLAATPEPLLLCFADALGNMGSPNLKGFNQTLIVFAGEHADILKAAGWSRIDVQRFLVEHTRRRLADFKRAARMPGAVTERDETTWRHIFERPEDILIACAGGRA